MDRVKTSLVDNFGSCKTAAQNETMLLLHRVLSQLPDRYRRTIDLHLFHERTFKEIGDEWACSPDAVRKLWIRALQQVGSKLTPLLKGRLRDPPTSVGG
jgi:DNA-directed RNA polymerase specialized sigma24 family protein